METPTMKPDTVLILDFGSQYTHLITRRIRSLNVFSLVINGTSSLKSITSYNPRVVILSGGPHSVHALDAPSFPDGFIEWAESNGVHVLGICYGLQLIVQKLGGVVVEGESKEYGKMEIEVKGKSEIFGSESVGDKQMVWMSHGDEAVKLPEGFEVVAQSAQGAVAALENRKKRIYGLQYHPEVLKLEESDYSILVLDDKVSFFSMLAIHILKNLTEETLENSSAGKQLMFCFSLIRGKKC